MDAFAGDGDGEVVLVGRGSGIGGGAGQSGLCYPVGLDGAGVGSDEDLVFGGGGAEAETFEVDGGTAGDAAGGGQDLRGGAGDRVELEGLGVGEGQEEHEAERNACFHELISKYI